MQGNQGQNTFQNQIFNNQQGMNQMNQFLMNQSADNLYRQNIQPTWQYMQMMNNFVNENNLNNKGNILSLINLPIVVPYHSQHPLISCITPGRAEISDCWICNCCGFKYSYNVPTFYCTACDFDVCQKCLLGLSALMISIYNYNMSNIKYSQSFTNYSHYHANMHEHPIVKIIRDETYAEIQLKCNFCFKDLQKNEQFYYCSLCNHCICLNCYAMKNINTNFVNNPEYLSADQMNFNNK